MDKVSDSNDSETTDDEFYKVEKVVGHRKRKGKNYFLIKWKGYDDSENTWEPEEHLNCQDLLDEYFLGMEEKNVKKTKPKKKNTKKAKKEFKQRDYVKPIKKEDPITNDKLDTLENDEEPKNGEIQSNENNLNNITKTTDDNEINEISQIETYKQNNEQTESMNIVKTEQNLTERNIEQKDDDDVDIITELMKKYSNLEDGSSSIQRIEESEDDDIKFDFRSFCDDRKRQINMPSMICSVDIETPTQCVFISKIDIKEVPLYFEKSVERFIKRNTSQETGNYNVSINISKESFEETVSNQSYYDFLNSKQRIKKILSIQRNLEGKVVYKVLLDDQSIIFSPTEELRKIAPVVLTDYLENSICLKNEKNNK